MSNANAKNNKAVQALLELGDDVELADDGTIKGLDEKIKALKKSDAYLFDDAKPSTTFKGANPASTNPNNPADQVLKNHKKRAMKIFLLK